MARIIAGELNGVAGPVAGVTTEPFYFDVRCEAGAAIEIPTPENHNAFAYVYEGGIRIGSGEGTAVARGEIALLGSGPTVSISAATASSLILVGGRPLNEPVARYGPFVMNNEDEIRQAFRDYREGRF